MSTTDALELPTDVLGQRLLREVLIARDGAWSSRADILEAAQEWAADEGVDLPVDARVYRALRLAGVPESKRQGVRGFAAGLRDADWTPEAQLDRFLRRDDLVTVTRGGAGWVPMARLHAAYVGWARDAHEEPMSMRKFAALMDGEGFSRQRRPDPSREPVPRRTPGGWRNARPTTWGWDGVVLVNQNG